ncbi:hypothetical protein ABW20_dc0103819 [Dactylellina cionopaga]|nr:hypothetical protein ABW20_dc0103819 [Dactylellina cionopaga]
MVTRPSLTLPQTSGKFDMERPLPTGSASSSSESLTDTRRTGATVSEPVKPRFSTTLKYSQMPLPTPPDSAGLEGYKLQLTLMPPTPGQVPAGYSSQLKARRKSQVLPYLLTVEDVEGDDQSECFSPSSTNYSAASEFGGPFSRSRDSEYTSSDAPPPVPPISPSVSNMSKVGSKRKSSRLSIQTSATDLMKEFNPEEAVVPRQPTTTSLIVLNEERRATMQSEAALMAGSIPMTPLTPNTPISPSLPLAKAMRGSGLSLAERRALAKSGAKIPTPLASPNTVEGCDDGLLTSPPPLTSRSAAHVEAGRLATPRTATPRTAGFNNVPKQEVSTPRSASFAVLPAPPTALPTPRSAAMFSPTRTSIFGSYIPHQNVPVAKSPANASFKSPKSATFSPRSVAFSPIHEDVDREKLRTPTAVNMLVERAQESQQGFVSGLMSPVILNQFQTLWNVANAQLMINQIFDLGMFREDSFTFTGAEHFTFGADATAAFYRLSAHPSHQQDALFSDLKIHRSNPVTQFEVPVIHLQLEAPTLEASGVVALIYPQVAGMVIEDKKVKKNPKLDVGDEAECCRLVYEPNKGFALFHPAKDEEGGWLNIVVTGRVGFDVIGADGSISICSSTHDEPLVTLDFTSTQLTINTAACNTINSFYIVDVAVAAVLTVATVEGRRLRAIQEDLDRILAYELATSPEMTQMSPQAGPGYQPNFDFSFAAAVGREGQDPSRRRPSAMKKKAGISRTLDDFLKALVRFLKALSGKKQKKARKTSVLSHNSQTPPATTAQGLAPPRNIFEEFEFPFQRESQSIHSRNNSYPTVEVNLPRPPSAAYIRDRGSRDLSTHH